jgi:hypothetical protein
MLLRRLQKSTKQSLTYELLSKRAHQRRSDLFYGEAAIDLKNCR